MCVCDQRAHVLCIGVSELISVSNHLRAWTNRTVPQRGHGGRTFICRKGNKCGDTSILMCLLVHLVVCVCVCVCVCVSVGVSSGSEVKASACNAGKLRSTPGLGRYPGEGSGHPLQYSCLENPWTEEPGGLQSRGVTELDMTEQLTL